MNFAPYQDNSPETNRVASPPPSSLPRPKRPFSPTPQDALPNPGDFENTVGTGAGPRPTGFGNGVGADERNIDTFSTSLPIRPDIEACLAYLVLPPAGGAILLLTEMKSDYVRFHAWQSSLVFGLLFIIHLIFSFSRVLSFLLLTVDLILIAFLTLHAYRDGESYIVPIWLNVQGELIA